MGVAGAAHTGGAQLLDRPGPGRGLEDAVDAAPSQLGRLGPPRLERRVLRAPAHGLDAEGRAQAVPAVVLPDVHDLGPPARGPEDGPHPVTELTPLLLALRAPVRRHVVHVPRPAVADDVDELVDVDLVVRHCVDCI